MKPFLHKPQGWLEACLVVESKPFDFPSSGVSSPCKEGIGLQSEKVKVKVKVNLLSRVQLFATPWTVAYKAPSSMGFYRQEY